MPPTALDVELGRFAAELDWDGLPASVQTRVLDIWVDAVANALVGRRSDNTAAVELLAGRLCGDGVSTVVGGGTAAMTAAALVNGYQITAFTMCDVYRPALCHVTPEVVPAVLALAESEGVGGAALLSSLAVGLEVTTRLGLGVDYPRFRAKGWHAPGVIGTVGAAAAAGRLLGLDAPGIRQAIGLGVSQAAGTFAALGTPAVKFHQARGAVSALWAALFAADGLGGSEGAVTHHDGGLLTTYADGGRPDLVLDRLGERWELEQISLRRWPAASSLQSLVGCLLSTDPDQLAALDVEYVEVTLPRVAYDLCAEMGWGDQLTAMQSARYVAAVVIHDQHCWIEQFADDRRSDPKLDEFARTRVEVRCDPDLPSSGVEVRIRRGGADLVLRRDTAPGDPGDPLTRTDVAEKLAVAVAGAASLAPADELTRSLFATAALPALSELCAGLRVMPDDAYRGVG